MSLTTGLPNLKGVGLVPVVVHPVSVEAYCRAKLLKSFILFHKSDKNMWITEVTWFGTTERLFPPCHKHPYLIWESLTNLPEPTRRELLEVENEYFAALQTFLYSAHKKERTIPLGSTCRPINGKECLLFACVYISAQLEAVLTNALPPQMTEKNECLNSINIHAFFFSLSGWVGLTVDRLNPGRS